MQDSLREGRPMGYLKFMSALINLDYDIYRWIFEYEGMIHNAIWELTGIRTDMENLDEVYDYIRNNTELCRLKML